MTYTPPHMPALVVKAKDPPPVPRPGDPSKFPKPYFATLAHNGLVSTFFVGGQLACVQQMMKAGFVWNWDVRAYDDDATGTRNSIVANFLATNASHLFFVGSHMGFTPNDVVRVLSSKQDIVAGAPPRMALRKGEHSSFCEMHIPEDIQGIGNELIEVEHVSFDFVCIRRRVFERLLEAHPDWFYTVPHENRVDGSLHTVIGFFEGALVDELHRGRMMRQRMTETQAFCGAWRALGGKVHVHMGVELAKVGSYVYRGSPHSSVERVGEVTITEKGAS